jgi:hypothetical protein
MVVGLRVVLLVIAVVLFVLVAMGISSGRYSLLGAGLACLAASMLAA